MPRYLYQRTGGPLLSWKHAAPQQTRASDTKALGGYESYPGGQLVRVAGAKVGQAAGLGCSGCTGLQGFGSLSGSSLDGPTVSMPLPRAGAPEPLPTLGSYTPVYESDGGFRHPMRGPFGAMPEASPLNLAIGAGVAFALYKLLKKR